MAHVGLYRPPPVVSREASEAPEGDDTILRYDDRRFAARHTHEG